MNPSRILVLGILVAFSFDSLRAAPSDTAPAELIRSAEEGDAASQFKLGRLLLTGGGGDEAKAQAFAWMKKAADQGYPDAIGGLGYFYANGVAVPRDEAAGVEWFRQGAAKGSARAQLNLGLVLANGRGVARDETEGLRLIDAAAATGLPEALYAQGETYFYAQFGRPQDYPRALTAFESAAKAGSIPAQNTLGVMVRDGLGTKRDEAAALRWFRQAAERGFAKAESNLGHSLGVNSEDRPRRIEAIQWLLLASDQNEITAVKTMEELTPNLAPEDLAEARKAADDFKQKQGSVAERK